ncbi:MAG: FMN-binding protein [Candidatus Aminicenantes bacterium]|nr:FMN-binding protein [Candidatus Aminicenantes bacterium]
MSLSARMIVVLTVVGLVSGSLLAVVGLLTKDRIEMNRQQEIQTAISQVIPSTKTSQKIYEDDSLTVYESRNESKNAVGYAVYTSGTGFQDIITLMYGTDPSLSNIKDLTILEQKETPGLGAKITDQEAFLRYWKNRNCEQPLSLRKPAVDSPENLDPSEVNTITGATISSEKVLDIVNASLERLKAIKEQGKLSSEEKNAS